MLHKGYLPTGENLHFPRSVQARYAVSIEREGTAKELQVVGDPNSTVEGMKQINTGGKSRRSHSSWLWSAKQYQRGNISYTLR